MRCPVCGGEWAEKMRKTTWGYTPYSQCLGECGFSGYGSLSDIVRYIAQLQAEADRYGISDKKYAEAIIHIQGTPAEASAIRNSAARMLLHLLERYQEEEKCLS